MIILGVELLHNRTFQVDDPVGVKIESEIFSKGTKKPMAP
jgi:hypothetical protein